MRKALAAGAGVVVVGLVVWFFALRGRDAAPPRTPQPAKPAKDPWLEAHPAKRDTGDHAAPRGLAPKWSLDVDPEGPLRLEGQVVDADGRGVGGANIALDSVPPRYAKSEDDGTFAFDKLVGRKYALSASRGELVGGPVTYKLTSASDPVVIQVGPGAALEIDVADDHAHAIANASIEVPGQTKREGKTDDKGHATIRGVRPGWIAVEASAPGFAAATSYTSVGSAGATGHVSLVLRKGAAVSGRVVDEAGKPLAKVHVTANDASGWSRGKDEQTTDDRGQFTFPALAPGSHTLSAVDGEHAPADSTPVSVTADRPVTGVVIAMKAGAVVSGTVVDADGKPRPFATVRVAGKGVEMWRVASRQATTDQQGRFELRGLSRAHLQARAESDVAASKLVDVDLATQAAVRDVRLVLDVTGTIAGIVVDEAGQPVPEVEVNAFPDLLAGASTDGLALAGMSSATTDGAGGFTIRGLPAGDYRL
ncbi:MAG: carboxypeptidase-like regulatory domain-containing protein, partial [Acidobacteriota bacterium]